MNAWVDAYEQAKQHSINFSGPAPDLFEGALLGNGGLGVVVTTRPDVGLIHFGHNNVWDIRIAEEHAHEFGNFQEVFDKLVQVPANLSSLKEDSWYRDYFEMTAENYGKSYPKPMPYGTLILRYDRREAEMLGHTALELLVDAEHDRLWMRMQGHININKIPNFNILFVIIQCFSKKKMRM